MLDRFAKSKACEFYYEGFGDSDEGFGERLGVTMKDSGNKMRDLGRYYEGFGEQFVCPQKHTETDTAQI